MCLEFCKLCQYNNDQSLNGGKVIHPSSIQFIGPVITSHDGPGHKGGPVLLPGFANI